MKIAIAGNYGAKNIGDEMILQGMLKMVTAVFPNSEITILSADPQETLKTHGLTHAIKAVKPFPAGIRSFFSSSTETKQAVNECYLFILGGGGLFSSLKFVANIIWGMQAFRAYSSGKKVWMYGQSIGPMKNFIVKFIVKKLFNKASLITVRDQFSREELMRNGVEKEIFVIPDMAFRTSTNTQPTIPRPNNLLIALRSMENLPENFISEIASFVDFLINEKGFSCTIVNFQQGIDSDEFLHEKLLSLISDQNKISYIKNPNFNDIEKLFSNSALLLGMRLHSIIAAIKFGTPFIAINYAPKMRNLLTDLKLDDYLLEIGDLSCEKLKTIFSELKNEEFSEVCQKNLTLHLDFEKTLPGKMQ